MSSCARIAESVEITIYDTKGTLVRRLALGNQAAGYYAERGKAAYWDGHNERGEAPLRAGYLCLSIPGRGLCGDAADGDCEVVASGLWSRDLLPPSLSTRLLTSENPSTEINRPNREGDRDPNIRDSDNGAGTTGQGR